MIYHELKLLALPKNFGSFKIVTDKITKKVAECSIEGSVNLNKALILV